MKTKTLVGLAAMMITLAVLVAGNWPAAGAEPVASIELPAPGAAKQLYPGCNNIVLTFDEGTSSATAIGAVDPPGAVEAMWRHNAAERRWEGFSTAAPQASNLLTVGFLDAVWLCLPAPAPTATVPGSPSGEDATPAPGSTTPASSGDQGTTPVATNTPPAGLPGQLPTSTPTPDGGGGGGGDGGGGDPPGTVRAVVAPTSALTSFSFSMSTSLEVEEEGLTISSSGVFKAPDSMSCIVTAFGFELYKMVVIGSEVWLDVGAGWTSPTIDDPEVVENLRLCPGSAVFWQTLGLPGDLGGIQGQLTTMNGVPAVQVSIVGLTQGPPGVGLIPPTSDGATVHAYDIWVAQDGGWVVALAFDATFSAEDGGARTQLRVDVTSPNDPSISVVPPA